MFSGMYSDIGDILSTSFTSCLHILLLRCTAKGQFTALSLTPEEIKPFMLSVLRFIYKLTQYENCDSHPLGCTENFLWSLDVNCA